MVMTYVGIPADPPGAVGWMMAFHRLATQQRDHQAWPGFLSG